MQQASSLVDLVNPVKLDVKIPDLLQVHPTYVLHIKDLEGLDELLAILQHFLDLQQIRRLINQNHNCFKYSVHILHIIPVLINDLNHFIDVPDRKF